MRLKLQAHRLTCSLCMQVYRAIVNATGQEIAVKKVDLEALGANLVRSTFSCPHVCEYLHRALPWHLISTQNKAHMCSKRWHPAALHHQSDHQASKQWSIHRMSSIRASVSGYTRPMTEG